MEYHLTLPPGVITLRDNIYQGSNTIAIWSPCNPQVFGGWQDGDVLNVVCTYNLNPANVNPMPPAREYGGLCAGATNDQDQAAITDLITQAKKLPLQTPGQLLGTGISTSATKSNAAIFYNAKSTAATFPLTPSSRGTLTNYIFKWVMTYNGNNTVVPSGNNVEIVFGYGDPMNSEVDS